MEEKDIIILKIIVMIISFFCLFFMISIKDLKTKTNEIEIKINGLITENDNKN